jgi:hypothetical protein
VGGEFQVNQTGPGEQREARTAADALGSFLVVWEDWQADAGGKDVFARRFSKLGFPLSDEWQVNTTTAGDQVCPEAAFDWVGNSVIVWEGRSSGTATSGPALRRQGVPGPGWSTHDRRGNPARRRPGLGRRVLRLHLRGPAPLDVYTRRCFRR